MDSQTIVILIMGLVLIAFVGAGSAKLFGTTKQPEFISLTRAIEMERRMTDIRAELELVIRKLSVAEARLDDCEATKEVFIKMLELRHDNPSFVLNQTTGDTHNKSGGVDIQRSRIDNSQLTGNDQNTQNEVHNG